MLYIYMCMYACKHVCIENQKGTEWHIDTKFTNASELF